MIQVQWYDDEQQIILWKMQGKWTLAEYHQGIDETSAMMASVNHRVDVIGDLADAIYAPPNITHTVKNRYQEIAQRDSNYGISVLVQPDEVVRTMMHILNHMPYTQNRFYIAPNFADAESMIQHNRAKSA